MQPVHHDIPRVGPQQPVDHLEGHALADARGAEQRQRLAVPHLETHAIQDHVVEEALVDVAELDHLPSNSFVITTSSSRIDTDAATTAVVAARPTPSAPCWVLYPM